MPDRLLVFLLLCGLPVSASPQAPIDFDWQAFAQLTAESVEERSGGVEFDNERLRFRGQVSADRLSGVLQVDAAVSDPGDDRPGTLANGLLDLYVNYQINERFDVRFGQFKTPLGMDFNRPAANLEITKRGPEFALTLNRGIGLMLSGDLAVPGLAFDVGVFNVPGRSAATDFATTQVGEDHAAVGRVRFDRERWHAELAHGRVSNAGGPGTRAYDATDAAVSYTTPKWLVRAEWISGDHVRGDTDRRERVYYLHGGYSISPTIDLLARHYRSRSTIGAATSALTNTYLGITATLHDQPQLNARLQLNYVIAGADRLNYTGLRGFRDNALLVQLQMLTRKAR